MYSNESNTTNSTTSHNRGVVLIAFYSKAYFECAYMLAKSIKHFSPSIHISLITDGLSKDTPLDVFDELINLPIQNYYGRNGNFEPGRAKLSVYDLLPYKHNLILDVDTLCIKPIDDLFDEFCRQWKPYLSLNVKSHTYPKDGDKFDEMFWAKPSNVWKHFQLEENATLPAINSSLVYVRKSDEAKSIYNTAHTLITDYPMPKALKTHTWGNAEPDELYMNVSLAMHGLDPSIGHEAMHFPRKGRKDIELIKKDYWFLSFYGPRGLVGDHYLEYIQKFATKTLKITFHISKIMGQKHANKTQ
jgi:hypothetical protein